MSRPLRAIIDPQAIAHNLGVIRQRAPHARVWAVVKANGYGHGLRNILAGVSQADGLALIEPDMAVRLREAGWTGPILLLEGFFDAADVALLAEHRLTTAVHCEDQLRMLELARPAAPIDICLKMNSGMNRLGFRPDAYRLAYARARAASAASAIGSVTHMTHFSDADGPRGIGHQLEVFDATTCDLPGQASLSNSAATLWHPHAHRDWVRPGIALYGAAPSGDPAEIAGLGLRAAMTLEAGIIAVQQLAPGDTVGYGSRFKAEQPMRVGVVACGYADGYPRIAGAFGATPALVDGVRTTLVGRVSMDMLMVDLSHLPMAGIGSRVELWGGNLSIDTVAASAGTIGYELMCALAPRVATVVLEASTGS